MEKSENKAPERKGLSKASLALAAIVLLGILYFLQKAGCNILKSEEKIEWIDR